MDSALIKIITQQRLQNWDENMKILRIEPYELNDDTLPKIKMPSSAEIDLAAMVTTSGEQLIKYWFEFNEELQNSDGSKIRNRAGTDIYNSNDVAGFTVVRNFSGSSLARVLQTKFRSYDSLGWAPTQNGHTVIAVAKAASDLAAGLNTFLIGQNDKNIASINTPSINLTGANTVRVFQGGVNGLLASVTVSDIKTNLKLITTTQSVAKGVGIRINKIETARIETAEAKSVANGRGLRLLGGAPSISAHFNGSVAAIIICNEDLTSRPNDLSKIEQYLSEKFGIA